MKGPLLMYRKWQESMKEFEQLGYLAKLRQLKEIEHQSEMAKLRQLKEFEHQSQMAELRQLKEFEHQSLLAKVRQLREENHLLKQLQSSRMRCKATTAACAPPNSMKLQARGQEEEEEIQNFNNVEGPEELGDQRAKMCLKRTAKDVSAGLQGTKKTRVSGQSSSQSNGQSQSDEPQPSNNSSAQQSICS